MDLRREVRKIQLKEGNQTCADCSAKKPSWASIDLGVFLCLNCAGVHRELGVHISKVRSVELDTWQEKWVENIKSIGNLKANEMFEARLDKRDKPNSEDSQNMTLKLRKFIRKKYEKRDFYSSAEIATRRNPTKNPIQSRCQLTSNQVTKNSIEDLLGFEKESDNHFPVEAERHTKVKVALTTEAESYEDKASKIMALFK